VKGWKETPAAGGHTQPTGWGDKKGYDGAQTWAQMGEVHRSQPTGGCWCCKPFDQRNKYKSPRTETRWWAKRWGTNKTIRGSIRKGHNGEKSKTLRDQKKHPGSKSTGQCRENKRCEPSPPLSGKKGKKNKTDFWVGLEIGNRSMEKRWEGGFLENSGGVTQQKQRKWNRTIRTTGGGLS